MIELRVPEVGESISDVQIGDWLKAEGEGVRRDEVVVMIETDKVTVELPAPVNGVISKIVAQRGARATVGDVIVYLQEAVTVVALSEPSIEPAYQVRKRHLIFRYSASP